MWEVEDKILFALVSFTPEDLSFPTKESVSGRSLSASLSRPDPVVAWYLDSNFPTVLQMTYKYGADFETAVLANANCGGENVARGGLGRFFKAADRS